MKPDFLKESKNLTCDHCKFSAVWTHDYYEHIKDDLYKRVDKRNYFCNKHNKKLSYPITEKWNYCCDYFIPIEKFGLQRMRDETSP